MLQFKTYILDSLKEVDFLKEINLEKYLEIPKERENADFSLPCFAFTKLFNKDPKDIALDIKNEIPDNELFTCLNVGPFVNFFINTSKVINTNSNFIENKKLNLGKTILIEYSSPNTNKSQHIGHLRNNILGVSISNIFRYCGYNTIKTVIFNDKGTAIAKTIWGYIHYGNNMEPNTIKSDAFVADFYVKASQAEKDDPKIKQEIDEINKKWEEEDLEIRQIWKKLVGWVYDGYKKTYKRLGCTFDKEYYESNLYKMGKEIVLKGLEEGVFKKSEGAIVSNLQAYNLPDTVLLKSDETTLYITQDIFLAKTRYEEFRPEKIIYVVANEQELYFKQLFSILDQLKIGSKDAYYHFSFGYISIPSGRMKSREGNVVDADTLLNEVVELSYESLRVRYPDLGEEELRYKAEIIGVGAVKFQFLKIDAFADFVFDPLKSISFEGDTSVYIQYTYARIKSLLRKADVGDLSYNEEVFSRITQEEKIIIKEVESFLWDYIELARSSYDPSILCKKLLNLAKMYNNFYQKNKILGGEDKDLQNLRLKLSEGVAGTINNILNILSIGILEEL